MAVFKRIVGFGDSWMYGTGIVDPVLQKQADDNGHPTDPFVTDANGIDKNLLNHPYREKHRYLKIIADHFNAVVENYGEEGNSLIGMRYNFIDWVSKNKNAVDLDETLIVFGLTESSRYSFFSAKEKKFISGPFLHDAWKDHTCHEMAKQHVVWSACSELYNYTLLDFYLTTKGICNWLGVKYIYAPVFKKNINVTNMDDISFEDDMKIELSQQQIVYNRGIVEGDMYKYCPYHNGHPNREGNRLIADYLIEFINLKF